MMSASEYPAEASAGRPTLATLPDRAAIRRIPADAWIVGGLVLLAAVIRFVDISGQSYWTDEALTAYEARLPFGAMLNTVSHVETTPPLYFVAIWVWAKIFGTGEAALRSFSALAGISIVPIAYLSAKELVSRRAGLAAAALATLNPFLIWYSQEARAYILLAALTGASFLFFIRARRQPSPRNLIMWAIFSGLGVATHYFAGFLVAPEAAWLLWINRTRAVAIAVGVVAFVQAAMIPLAFVDTSHGAEWIHAIPMKMRIGQIPLQFGLSTIYRQVTIFWGFLGGALLIVAVVLLLRLASEGDERRGAAVAAVIAGVILLVPLALGLVGPDYFLARNLTPAWIPLATVVAAACVVPRARIAGAALLVALLGMFVAATLRIEDQPDLQRPIWRDVAHALGPAPVTRGVLVAGGATANPLKIYLPNVAWVQPHRHAVLISEVDVVGTRTPLPVAPKGSRSTIALPARAPIGTRPLGRVRVGNFVVARFALPHPWLVDNDQLVAQAPRFFHRAPLFPLPFIQRASALR
jgi:4-amino-4-deoxy-L-arabinose transferase-like glycosyltransferase